MKTSPKDPAFPVVAFDQRGEVTTLEESHGLSKLEEFASRNLAAMIPIHEAWCIQNSKAFDDENRKTVARDAVYWANALIDALNEQQ